MAGAGGPRRAGRALVAGPAFGLCSAVGVLQLADALAVAAAREDLGGAAGVPNAEPLDASPARPAVRPSASAVENVRLTAPPLAQDV